MFYFNKLGSRCAFWYYNWKLYILQWDKRGKFWNWLFDQNDILIWIHNIPKEAELPYLKGYVFFFVIFWTLWEKIMILGYWDYNRASLYCQKLKNHDFFPNLLGKSLKQIYTYPLKWGNSGSFGMFQTHINIFFWSKSQFNNVQLSFHCKNYDI